jgi:hypothetical protein
MGLIDRHIYNTHSYGSRTGEYYIGLVEMEDDLWMWLDGDNTTVLVTDPNWVQQPVTADQQISEARGSVFNQNWIEGDADVVPVNYIGQIICQNASCKYMEVVVVNLDTCMCQHASYNTQSVMLIASLARARSQIHKSNHPFINPSVHRITHHPSISTSNFQSVMTCRVYSGHGDSTPRDE